MIELKPFDENDFETLKSWFNNREELFQFSGPLFTFPLSNEQLRSYLDMSYKKPLKVVLKSTNKTIGHCELNFEGGKNRLSRIIVGEKGLRGQKIGEQIVRKMVNLLFEEASVNEVDLNTFEWNKQAIRCYEKVGFKINHKISDKLFVNGKVWKRINMTLKIK